MLVGASGLGKTSFISTLLEKTAESVGEFSEHSLTIGGQDVRIIDTRGYGAHGDTAEKQREIKEYISLSYHGFLDEETRSERDVFFDDRRVHLVVHFLSVTAHGMKDYDLSLMKALHEHVNVIAAIPRCDQHTEEELENIRKTIRYQIQEQKIDLFSTEEIPESNTPIALFGADSGLVNGKPYTGRSLPTGTILLHDEKHCDFFLFVKLISEARRDMMDTTKMHFYEKYRRSCFE